MASTDSNSNHLILIIDDDEEAYDLLRRLLRRVGATESVEWCSDGEHALARLQELAAAGTPPTLVILDLKMPGMDGFDVLAAMKSDPQLASLFVVVVSSSSLPEDIARAIQMGAFCYFEKYPLPEKFGPVYKVARDRSPSPATIDGCETALRQMIELVDHALAVVRSRPGDHNAVDRELMESLSAIRRRATERFLDRVNHDSGRRWPFPMSSP